MHAGRRRNNHLINLQRPFAGFGRAAVTIAIFPDLFVATRFGVTRGLRVRHLTGLRISTQTTLLAPTLLRHRIRVPLRSWLEELFFALLWGVPLVLQVTLDLQLTLAGPAVSMTPKSIPECTATTVIVLGVLLSAKLIRSSSQSS
jgi:hypothetical protein